MRREVDGIADHQAGVASRLQAQIDAALSAADLADSTGAAALVGVVLPVISPPPSPVNGASFAGLTTLAAALGDLSALQRMLGGRPDFGSARLKARLDQARALGQTPAQYRELLKQYWQATTLERAGIHPASWRPELGVDHNRENILKVYEYYRGLYEQDQTLEWAGLANMVGPGFAAAFLDLDRARDVARRAVKQPVLPPGLKRETVKIVATLSDYELQFYETTFLTMQKDIFLDIGAMHQAYLAGPDNGVGMRNLQEMAQAGLIEQDVLATWRTIDRGRRTGSAGLLHRGAVELADHEQNEVIAGNWDVMREHAPGGAAVTYLMTVIGKPSVPGARYPGQVRPLPLSFRGPLPDSINTPDKVPLLGWDLPDRVPLPSDDFTVEAPLPDFNVSVREDRWDYFLADTMPAYERLLDEPGRATMTAEMARPLEDRIGEQRIWQRLRDVIPHLDSRSSLEVE